ncbi:MAG: hypothetical protein HW416_2087 [Chloroflexi bacterium]|nr:hypothetical protein [Chloroflexota bacterium]
MMRTVDIQYYSTILFARPSGWEGAARILDFGNLLTEYMYSNSVAQADYFASRSDWEAVGADLFRAMREISYVPD